MRVAIVSDIHGNRTALEAVLCDLRQTCPDLILHGGDLADTGANPVEVVDRIRDLGWQGVVGNTDEMLFRPQSLEEFAAQSSAPPSLWSAIRAIADETRSRLGEDRIAWLSWLQRFQIRAPVALLHASPDSLWRAPGPAAANAELESIYGPLDQPVTVYGHIHWPSIRTVSSASLKPRLIANSGSVGLPYDGDRRASYLLLDGLQATIRRVEYDLDKELMALSASDLPYSHWIAKTLQTASPQMP